MADNKMVVIDPINYKKYIFDLDEIRNWIDIKSLKHLLASNQEAKFAFNALTAKEKESLLLYIENHEDSKCFDIDVWDNVSGIDIDLDFILQYNPDTVAFYDKVNSMAKEYAFKTKKIKTKAIDAFINIGNTRFPIRVIWGISEDFIKIEDLKDEDLIPMFSSYYGDETNLTTKILLDNKSISSPVHFFSVVGKEDKWTYNVQITVKNNLKFNNIMWHGVPNTKKLYNFFNTLGFEINNKNSKIVEWRRNKTIIQYFKTPKHFYEPFLLIKQVKGKTDLHLRNELGDILHTKMEETGLLEEIFFYQGQDAVNNALSYLETYDKLKVDDLLLDAINSYNRCNKSLKIKANAQNILCEWIKGRVGNMYENAEYVAECNERIVERITMYRNWAELIEFTNFLNSINEFNPTIVKSIFPMNELERKFFVSDEEINQLKELWDYFLMNDLFENIADIKIIITTTYSLGLYKTCDKFFKLFMKRLKKENDLKDLGVLCTEEILNIAIALGEQKEYLSCCNKFIKFYDYYKSQQDFSDLSYVGRKNYRWNSFCGYMGLFKFMYHKAYLLQSMGKNLNEANDIFYNSIDVFQDGTVFIDISENYSDEQFLFIIENFITLYNMAMLTKNMELVDNIIDFMVKFWNKKPSFFLYENICSLYSTEDRDKMAEDICELWRQEYGEEFYKKKELIPDLIFLYLSVENWESVVDSLKFALKTYSWSFEELANLYSLYERLIEFTEQENFEEVTSLIYEEIDKYKGETFESQVEIKEVFNQMYSLLQ